MSQGKVPCLVLLELVHRAAITDTMGPADAARLISDILGDVVIVLRRGQGPASIGVEAVAAPGHADAERWKATLGGVGSLMQGGLGQTYLLGRPRVLPTGPWPTPGSPSVQVLLVPLIARRHVLGVVAVVRDPAAPAFSEAEEQAVAAVAGHAGTLAALAARERQAEGARDEAELMRSSLRFLAGHLDSDLALEPLLVQARQALAAAGVLLLLRSAPDSPLHLAAASGAGSPPADPAVEWHLDSSGAIEAALADRGKFFTGDTGALDFGGGPLAKALAKEPGPLWAGLVQAGAELHGVLLVSWASGITPTAELKGLASHVAELASLYVSHGRLAKEAVGARAGERVAAELAAQRDVIVRQIVHDLRNSLHALGFAAEEIEYKPEDPARVRAALATIIRHADFMGAYLRDQIDSLEAQPLEGPPRASLEHAFGRLEALAARLEREGRTLRVGRLDPVQVRIPQIQLDRILELLVFEASGLAKAGGTLEVWAAVADGWATIMVEDDGPGLDLESQARLATAKRERNGHKSGIRAIEELVTAAGGQFGFRTRTGDRTSFHVGLPSIGWAGGA